MEIALGIYCGMAWMFMIGVFCMVPGRADFTDYLAMIFAPIALPIITGYELWISYKKH